VVFLNSILIFAKAPLRGVVKTRLQKSPILGESDVLVLYEAFLKDVFQSACCSTAERIYIAYYPGGKKEKELMKSLMRGDEGDRIVFFDQEGTDFDERFTKAVERAFEESKNVVVIGSDSPQIQPETINGALDLLRKTECMVIGPSNEGGVYLVGVGRPINFKRIFSVGVESENLAALALKLGISFHLLEELKDIDVESDLIDFICNIKAMETASKFNNFKLPMNSISAIKKLGLRVNDGRGGERGRRLVKN
jgi:glycosyltransferase A (GT-A) superfamily protein (DUF2064 family)